MSIDVEKPLVTLVRAAGLQAELVEEDVGQLARAS